MNTLKKLALWLKLLFSRTKSYPDVELSTRNTAYFDTSIKVSIDKPQVSLERVVLENGEAYSLISGYKAKVNKRGRTMFFNSGGKVVSSKEASGF
jgi:hypothetical protein